MKLGIGSLCCGKLLAKALILVNRHKNLMRAFHLLHGQRRGHQCRFQNLVFVHLFEKLTVVPPD